MKPSSGLVATGLAGILYATEALGQASFTAGDNRDVRYQWAVPESAIEEGAGSTYLRIESSTSYSWVALGIGEAMDGAQMFIVYQDGKGNVTLSTRLGTPHTEPQYAKRSNIELLSGSGVKNNKMIAEIRCYKCENLKVNGETKWLAAWAAGTPINSTDLNAPIHFHSGREILKVNLAKANITSETNIFNRDNDDGSDYAATVQRDDMDYTTIRTAHGIIMTVLFIVLYPMGAILMPLFNWWYAHAISQCVSYVIMWAGFALGLIFARHYDLFKNTHPQLGVIIVVLLSFQPVLGYLHHRDYSKTYKTGLLGHIHSWHGRGLMILGVVNGGLGLKMADQIGGGWFYAYVVIAAIVAAAYVASIFYSIRNKIQQRNQPPRTVVVQAWSGPALRLRSR